MTKEIKIGLAVITVLLCVFGGVLAWRLKTDKPTVATKSKTADGKSAAKKPPKKGRPKITAGNHPPAFKTPAPVVKDDLFAARDRYGDRYAAKDGSEDVAEVRQNAWSNDTYSNPAETEEITDDAPDVADSPYGRNGSDQRDHFSDQDAPGLVPGGLATDAGHEGRDYRSRGAREDAGHEGRDYRDAATEDMADDVALPEDRFADNAAAEPNWAQHEEAVDDSEVPNQPRLSVDPYADRFADHTDMAEGDAENSVDEKERGSDADDDLRLAPLATSDRAVRPAAIGRDDEEAADREFSDAELRDPATDMAAESAAPRRLADAADDEVYRVEANDNFWLISQKVYGTGAYFKALQEHNRGRSREAAPLHAGDEISTPPLDVLRDSYPDLCPKPRSTSAAGRASPRNRSDGLYTVAEGDTLFDIARHELGKASRWLEIYELNRDQLGDDFTRLAPGAQLALPGDSAEPIASRPRRDTILR